MKTRTVYTIFIGLGCFMAGVFVDINFNPYHKICKKIDIHRSEIVYCPGTKDTVHVSAVHVKSFLLNIDRDITYVFHAERGKRPENPLGVAETFECYHSPACIRYGSWHNQSSEPTPFRLWAGKADSIVPGEVFSMSDTSSVVTHRAEINLNHAPIRLGAIRSDQIFPMKAARPRVNYDSMYSKSIVIKPHPDYDYTTPVLDCVIARLTGLIDTNMIYVTGISTGAKMVADSHWRGNCTGFISDTNKLHTAPEVPRLTWNSGYSGGWRYTQTTNYDWFPFVIMFVIFGGWIFFVYLLTKPDTKKKSDD